MAPSPSSVGTCKKAMHSYNSDVSRAYHYDGLEVLPAGQFLKRLHEGGVF